MISKCTCKTCPLSLFIKILKVRIWAWGDPGELSHVYILYHSAEMKVRIPKLNVVSKTLKGLLALYNVTVGPIAAVYPQEGHRKKW